MVWLFECLLYSPMTGLVLIVVGFLLARILAKFGHVISKRTAYAVMAFGIVLVILGNLPRTGGLPPPYSFDAKGIAQIGDVHYDNSKQQLSVTMHVVPKHSKQFSYRMNYKNISSPDRWVGSAWLSIQSFGLISKQDSYSNDTQLVCPMDKAKADSFIKQQHLQKNNQIPVMFNVGGCGGCLRTFKLITPACPK